MNEINYKITRHQSCQSWLNTNELRPRFPCVRCAVNDSIIYGALARGVCVFKHVYGRMLDTLSYHDSIYIYLAAEDKKFYFRETCDTMFSLVFVARNTFKIIFFVRCIRNVSCRDLSCDNSDLFGVFSQGHLQT